jgi:hypothetical protein
MRASAHRIFFAILAVCILGLASLSPHIAQAQGVTKEEAVKKLEAKGAKFVPKAEFDKNPLLQKTKGGRAVVPSFSCSTNSCTCTGAIDCMDLGLDTNLCKMDSFECHQTSAGPSCVCSRNQP